MSQTVNEAVAAELRGQMAKRGITGAGLARKLQAPNAMWIHRRLSGTVELSVDDLVSIADGLGVAPLDVLAQALSDIGHLSALPAVP